jgi:hypothetical protein
LIRIQGEWTDSSALCDHWGRTQDLVERNVLGEAGYNLGARIRGHPFPKQIVQTECDSYPDGGNTHNLGGESLRGSRSLATTNR